MIIVMCDKCWREFEVEDNEEWGYCPFCENDQVEVKLQVGLVENFEKYDAFPDLIDLTYQQIRNKLYQIENRDKLNEYRKQWRKNNIEKVRMQEKKSKEKYKTKNIEKFREMSRKRAMAYYYKHKEEILLKRKERLLKKKLEEKKDD